MVGKKAFDNKKNILYSFFLLLVVVSFVILSFIRIFMETGISMENKCKVVPIRFFDDRVSLYIVMRDYGLNLQYCHTIISEHNICSDTVAIDHKIDIIRESVDRIYYKIKQPDSLFIIEPSWNYKTDFYEIAGINIMIRNMRKDSLEICTHQGEYQLLELYYE